VDLTLCLISCPRVKIGTQKRILNLLVIDLNLKFQEKGGLDELLGGIYDHSTDTFLWERFMLKPYVVENKIKYVGNIVTPWFPFEVLTPPKALFLYCSY
jgi:hypothetical protein